MAKFGSLSGEKSNQDINGTDVNENTYDGLLEEIELIKLNSEEQGKSIANIEQLEDEIKQLIKNQIEVKDELIDKLHEDLNSSKKDNADLFSNQLMKAVIKVRKDMKKIISSDKWKDMSADDLRREYTYLFEDLTDLLEQQNVDPYSTSEGETFDASIHQVGKIELTDDLLQDKIVKISISEGYKKGDKVLIPERVIVYQYKNKE